MAALADRAGVSIDTVYPAVGRKPQVMRALVESALSGTPDAVPAAERDYVQCIRAAATAQEKIEIYTDALDLRSTGEMRDDMSDDHVADIVWSMNSAEYYALLVDGRRWTSHQYRDWLRDCWSRSFLRRRDVHDAAPGRRYDVW